MKRTIEVLAIIALLAAIAAYMTGVRVGSHIALCQPDNTTCYTDGQTIGDADLRAAHLVLTAEYAGLGTFAHNTAVFRLYDSSGTGIDAANLDLDTTSASTYFAMADLLKNAFQLKLQQGENYTIQVTYGTVLGDAMGGRGDLIGQTTFTYNLHYTL